MKKQLFVSVCVIAALGCGKKEANDGQAVAVGGSPAAAATTETAAPAAATPVPAPAARPLCGMPAIPGRAKDPGKIDMKLDGANMCANQWQMFAFGEGMPLTLNLLWYSETGNVEDGGSSLPNEKTKPWFDFIDKSKRINVGITHSNQAGEGGDYTSVTIEIGGFQLGEWQGPIKADVAAKAMGYVFAKEPQRKLAYVSAELKRNGVTEQHHGLSGTVTFESYDFAKQAFKGTYNVKVGPVAGVTKGGTEHAIEGTFDVRAFD